DDRQAPLPPPRRADCAAACARAPGTDQQVRRRRERAMSEAMRARARSCPSYPALALFACIAAGVIGAALPVHSQERNFAGSLQTNYLWVVTDPHARDHTFDGFSNEL